MIDKICTHHIFFYFSGALFLWPISYLTVNSGVPTVWCPFSITVVIPALLLSGFINPHIAIIIAASFIPIFFFFWSTPLLKGKKEIPIKTKIVSLFFIALSITNLIFSWEYGEKYQGITHTLVMCAYNVIFWVVLFLLFKINKKTKNYISNFLFHWVLFAWLGWVSFPWLGELI